jgi:hypothetical protein
MAGIKVTDLPVLATPATDDVLYIVDTSTNTSKQISVEDATSLSIPLAGTTQMGAAEITHTSTGKTDTIGFIDGSVYIISTGAAGNGNLSTSGSTALIEYNAAVSGYSSTVSCTDGVINLGVNGNTLALEFDGSNNKIGFFGKTSATSVQASPIIDATNATDVITQLNTLLAAMRAYGLIAE